MTDSRISHFYRLGIAERIAILLERGIVDEDLARRIANRRGMLSVDIADRMVENVIGVFGLPLAIAPNFVINGREYIVPMVVEEPSVVAAVSFAAQLARDCGGFTATSTRPVLIGQVYLHDIADADESIARLKAKEQEITDTARRLQPSLVARGGGVIGVEFRKLLLPDQRPAVAVHLLVDTRDAMGANAVNALCENMAEQIARIAGGKPGLKILSNLADRSMICAKVRISCDKLGANGSEVCDRIVLANDIALTDPYRAATHNKGIMNGMDAVAIATGNDWRALEAGAHAFAARDGAYKALTLWSVAANGDLAGEINVPVRMGIVGGSLRANPAALAGLSIAGARSSQELGEVIGVVGLAQNFAALRALATDGIQKGHMRLHARSVAASAGVPLRYQDRIIAELIACGDIKEDTARTLLSSFQANKPGTSKDVRGAGEAAGKVILLGEHAVVYGRAAIALPLRGAIRASIHDNSEGLVLNIPAWRLKVEVSSRTSSPRDAEALIRFIVDSLGVTDEKLLIEVDALIPPAAGLGASAALAVSIIRAFDDAFHLGLDDQAVNALAFECEKLAHGTPSGIDNTLAVHSRPILFNRNDPNEIHDIPLRETPPLVVAFSGVAGSTRTQVAAVRTLYERNSEACNRLFDEIGRLSLTGYDALVSSDYERLGIAMNSCHGLLNALQVSTPVLEEMVHRARASGAVGAKLTGGGGGGSVVALCPDRVDQVKMAFHSAGFEVIGGAQ
ncbi:MAG: hydroxymethylglutaryl-CoA reductase, degradative [Woeseiaceae bacterium]